MTQINRKCRAQRGFTLVELMVVVAIIGILAAIGIPEMTKFIRNAETAEPISTAARIEKVVRGFYDARPQSNTATLTTAVNNKVVSGACSTNCLTDVIPEASVASDHGWYYTVSVAYSDTESVPYVCIRADEANDAGTGAENTTAPIFYSSRRSVKAEWNNHGYVNTYVAGSAFVAGGSCSDNTPTAVTADQDSTT